MKGTEKQIGYAQDLQNRAIVALDGVLAQYTTMPASQKLAKATAVANIVRGAIANCECAGDLIDLLKIGDCTVPAVMAAIKFGTGRLAMSIKAAIKEVTCND